MSGAIPERSNIETRRPRVLAAALLVALAVACGGGGPASIPFRGPIERVLEEPWAFDGRVIEVRGWYLDRFGDQVLASGLAESYPPQAAGTPIWLSADPPEGDCLFSDIGVTWGRVVATGLFRYEEDGAFGPVGVLPMELRGARLACSEG